MALSIAEVLEEVSKAKTREDKREVLKKNESWSLRALLQQNFHPQASWLIPPGSPPYNANQNSADTSLLYEAKKLEYYTSGKQKIPMLKREAMFVSLLERLSPDEARDLGEEIITGKFPLAANGRALTLEAEKTGGFIRVTARKSDHVILGIQAVGTHIAELSGEFVLALEMGALLEDIADTVHAHPTMTESFHEGVLKTLGHAIHIS